jgi:hypothetical protein
MPGQEYPTETVNGPELGCQTEIVNGVEQGCQTESGVCIVKKLRPTVPQFEQ